MIKSELIARLSEENPHLTQRDVERVVGVILERMIQALETDGRVELRGFGALSVRSRDARAGRNPRTGETVEVPAKSVPFFKSGKELRERLNAILAEKTGQPVEQIARDTDRDRFMSSDEAQTYGLIDQVLRKRESADQKK